MTFKWIQDHLYVICTSRWTFKKPSKPDRKNRLQTHQPHTVTYNSLNILYINWQYSKTSQSSKDKVRPRWKNFVLFYICLFYYSIWVRSETSDKDVCITLSEKPIKDCLYHIKELVLRNKITKQCWYEVSYFWLCTWLTF